MKKCFIPLFVLLSVSCVTIHANSAPIYGDYPGSVTVIPLDDHDIHIISETLIFDFQNNIAYQEIEFGFRSPVAIVKAIYEMMNFGDGQYLKMAFPFYGTMSSELLEKTSIKMNDNTVNHKIYYGKLSDYYEFSGFEIESMYQEMVVIEEEFFQESVGLLYTFTQTEEDVYVVLEDHLEMQVIQSGFYRQYQSENIVLSGRGELQNPEIFILSNSSILDVQGLDVEVEEITYQTYLERFILNTTYSYEHAQVAFLEVLHYLSYNRTAYKSNLEYFLLNDRLMIFEYEAFVENGYNVMEVEYANMGAVYSRFTPYKYEYKYFLQPATLWKSFQNLTVQIYLSDDVAF